jgi:hypothetical protein
VPKIRKVNKETSVFRENDLESLYSQLARIDDSNNSARSNGIDVLNLKASHSNYKARRAPLEWCQGELDSQQVGVNLVVAVLDGPEVEGNDGQFIHDGHGVPIFG